MKENDNNIRKCGIKMKEQDVIYDEMWCVKVLKYEQILISSSATHQK